LTKAFWSCIFADRKLKKENTMEEKENQTNEIKTVVLQDRHSVSLAEIQARIFTIRGVQVMLDRDLAILYHVTTKALNQAVKRNIRRFPERFMFQLTKEEFENWKS
jgi:hypothetical protein